MMNPASGDTSMGRSISERSDWPDLRGSTPGRTAGVGRHVSTPQDHGQECSASKPDPLDERNFWLVPIDRDLPQ